MPEMILDVTIDSLQLRYLYRAWNGRATLNNGLEWTWNEAFEAYLKYFHSIRLDVRDFCVISRTGSYFSLRRCKYYRLIMSNVNECLLMSCLGLAGGACGLYQASDADFS